MEGGSITIFCQKFLFHIDERLRRGPFLCFKKILLSKNVPKKKRPGYHDFPAKLFCLTVPNLSVV